MVDVNKPDCLILPPDFIYSDEFHSSFDFGTSLYKAGTIGEIFNLENGFLWHVVVKMSLIAPNNNIKNKQDIKGFCQSIYGVCNFGHSNREENLFTALIYLDNMSYLPRNLIDDSYYSILRNKYYCHKITKVAGGEYTLISSRLFAGG